LKSLLELLLGPQKQRGQVWVGKITARFKVGFFTERGEFIPRANKLAVVTAVNPIPHFCSQSRIDGAFVFDGEIGDAAPCIKNEGRDKGASRAGVEEGGAGAAMLFTLGFRVHKRNVSVDFAEKKPRSCRFVDEHGVLRDPAHTRLLGDGTLKDWRAIDKRTELAGREFSTYAFGQFR